jgi:hypothetical protein
MKNQFLLFVFTWLFMTIQQPVFAQNENVKLSEVRTELSALGVATDSFGKNVKFFGAPISGVVLIYTACDPVSVETILGRPLGANDRCVVAAPYPNLTSFDVRDIGRVTLPANTVKTVLYRLANHSLNYQLFNTTGTQNASATFRYQPYMTIESAALNDPRAIDPTTGLPLNGRLDISVGGNRTVTRTMNVGERDNQFFSYSRGDNDGLTKSFFRENYNLPPDIVNNLFNGQITIRLNMRGTVRLVDQGILSYGIRLLGN